MLRCPACCYELPAGEKPTCPECGRTFLAADVAREWEARRQGWRGAARALRAAGILLLFCGVMLTVALVWIWPVSCIAIGIALSMWCGCAACMGMAWVVSACLKHFDSLPPRWLGAVSDVATTIFALAVCASIMAMGFAIPIFMFLR